MTTGRWTDRVLGTNRKADLPLNVVWLGTSNNAVLTSDMIGRTLHIRMETDCEQPALRTGFKHANLLAHIRKQRSSLAMAALSFPAHYIKAGRPDMDLPGWGGFEGWSNLVRSSLVWAGLPDPGETRETLAADADDDTQRLSLLMDAWTEFDQPITVGEAVDLADSGRAPLLAAFMDCLSGNRKTALGHLLRNSRRRVIDGQRLDRTDAKRPKWYVSAVSTPA